MALGLSLIALSLIALIYGIVKKRRGWIIAGSIALVVIAALWAVYSYLYSLTPY